MEHPILIVVRGLPGSGKTYLAERLCKQLDSLYGDGSNITLDPDTIDRRSPSYKNHVSLQTKEGVDSALHPYRFLRAQAYEAIEAHKIIVWNQPFTNPESFQKVIARLQEYAAQHRTQLPILIVEVNIDQRTAKQRVHERKKAGGHGPSESTFTRFCNDYESFASLGFATIQVDGTNNPDLSIQKITDALPLQT